MSDRLMRVLGRIVRPVVYLMLLLPPVIVILASLTAGNSLRFPPEGLSLKWYGELWGNHDFMSSLWLSTKLGLATTVSVVVIGFCAAYALRQSQASTAERLKNILLSPLLIPMVVLGLGLLQFLSWIGLSQTFFGLLIGHIIITLPYVVSTVTAGFTLFDPTMEEAAVNLRASRLTTITRVTIPLLAPSIMSGAIFAFVTSFGNITLSIFLSFGGDSTFPVQLFTYIEHSYLPIIAAASTVVIVFTMLLIMALSKLVGLDQIGK